MIKTNENSSRRLIPLEGCRGIAAFVVLAHHFFIAFSPSTTGYLNGFKTDSSLIGQPYFALFNGTAAVGFFFTLSGFVLCWSYFQHENARMLSFALVKRLPRLMGLVVLTTLGSYLLLKFKIYWFDEASKLTLSPWLATFADSKLSPNFEPSFIKALFQGITTFLIGGVSYNTVLWTMNIEFFGSMVVYMLACFISTSLKFKHTLYAFTAIGISSLKINPLIFPFVAGTFLSAYLAKNKTESDFSTSIILLILGLYLLGYATPEKYYTWLFFKAQYAEQVRSIVHTLGSILLIFSIMTNRKLFNFLDNPFLKWIGKISFSIYLVHCLVIFSFSSYLYLVLSAYDLSNQLRLAIVFVSTVLASTFLSIPLSNFDDWWVKKVNVFLGKYLFSNK